MIKETPVTAGEEKKIIGIVSTMKNEIQILKDSMEIEAEETVSGMTFYKGTLGGHPVAVVRCGRGKVNAGACAQTLIVRFGAKSVIDTGVAGSLNSEINIGSIIISTDAVQHDVDGTALGCRRGMIPGNTVSIFPADPGLRRSAVSSAAAVIPQKKIFEGRVCSGDQFIADRGKKQRLGEEFSALCCDMEGAALAQVCAMNGTPYVLIRAVSDKADDVGHLSYQGLFEAVARHCTAIVRHMVENA